MELKLLKLLLDHTFFTANRTIVTRDMFPSKELATLYDTICDAHEKYGSDITVDELYELHLEFNPTLTKPARGNTRMLLDDVEEETLPNPEVARDIAVAMWRRDRARVISEEAMDIWLGHETDFEKLGNRIKEAIEGNPTVMGQTYVEVTDSLELLLADDQFAHEFKFTLKALVDVLPGMGRGNLGIIMARPEVGKTTFATHLAAEYLRQGFKVAYFMNEEPARKTKLRIMQAFLGLTKEEMSATVGECKKKFNGAGELLKVYDAVGMEIDELNSYCAVHGADVVIIDQLDKMRVKGDFGRGDERLKQLYVETRELAKRNNCLAWGVSQASAEAEGKDRVDYHMLDNSKTGKPGEADVIIGIGKGFASGDDDPYRGVFFSKNKVNGIHGFVTLKIEPEKGRYVN